MFLEVKELRAQMNTAAFINQKSVARHQGGGGREGGRASETLGCYTTRSDIVPGSFDASGTLAKVRGDAFPRRSGGRGAHREQKGENQIKTTSSELPSPTLCRTRSSETEGRKDPSEYCLRRVWLSRGIRLCSNSTMKSHPHEGFRFARLRETLES